MLTPISTHWFSWMIYHMFLQMINGLMQRLTQKEKEVIQLLGEIDRLKIQHSAEPYDSVS